jgi:hypothetical protein
MNHSTVGFKNKWRPFVTKMGNFVFPKFSYLLLWKFEIRYGFWKEEVDWVGVGIVALSKGRELSEIWLLWENELTPQNRISSPIHDIRKFYSKQDTALCAQKYSCYWRRWIYVHSFISKSGSYFFLEIIYFYSILWFQWFSRCDPFNEKISTLQNCEFGQIGLLCVSEESWLYQRCSQLSFHQSKTMTEFDISLFFC